MKAFLVGLISLIAVALLAYSYGFLYAGGNCNFSRYICHMAIGEIHYFYLGEVKRAI